MSVRDPLVVVGSGPSAVHFAQTALEKGRTVTMLDVGRERPEPVEPGTSFFDLKGKLDDPARYLLGERYQAVLFPGTSEEYYGFPPSKDYVFRGLEGFETTGEGFSPLFSFARGGLAEAWTGGVFPFNGYELEDFPFGYSELAPWYELVSRRIGINGAGDDMARHMPVHADMLPPLDLDENARVLFDRYQRRRDRLRRIGVRIGRSRSATITRDHAGRRGCEQLGRCLWGCPTESLYTPGLTLRELERDERFQYRPGLHVTHFELDAERRVAAVVAERTEGGGVERQPVGTLVLAAGTLSSSQILLESIRRATGRVEVLHGLMDNRQALVPFVNLSMLGKRWEPQSFQYHQLILGIEGRVPKEYVHGQITTLKTALIHPIVQNVPLDLATSLFVFKNVHAALGLVNVNLHDTRRDECWVTLEPTGDEGCSRLVVHYEPSADDGGLMDSSLRTVKRALWRLGCVAPPGMTHVRPMGASVHYSGTLPMSSERRPLTVDASCRSHDFENLVLADGASFPFLPAKNLTFTLMANAARVADAIL